MKRKALAVAGVAALATFSIAGAALAAGADDPVRPSSSVTGSPSPDDSPDDSPSPTDTASPDDSPTASPDDSPTTTAPAQPGGDNVPSDLAAAVAVNKVGGGVVTRIESELEHGRAVWKIRVVKDGVRYDVRVDKQTGEIVRFENKGAESGGSGNGNSGNSGSGRSGGDDKGGSSGSGKGGGGSGRGGHDDPPGDDHGGGGHGSDD